MKHWIEQEIASAVAGAEVAGPTGTRWRAPLVRYASAHDPLFGELKRIVRPTHATPQDLVDGAESVIVWFLPFEREIPRGNRPGRYASDGWTDAYVETNGLVRSIAQRLADGLAERGHRSAVLPPTHNFDTETLMSDWSHKHVGYIAGMGQFGLHQMLITPAGSAGRLGSLPTTAVLEPSPRSLRPARLWTLDQSCTACVDYCPVSALSLDGRFDRHACWNFCLENKDHNGRADACGKCLSVVPCTYLDPVGAKLGRAGVQAGAPVP